MPAFIGASVAVRLAVSVLSVLALVFALLGVASSDADAAHRHKTRWDCLAHFESTHRWHINTGNGHYGGLQFSLSTWRYYGGHKYSNNKWPHKATRREQIHVAKRVAFHGWRDHRPQGGASAWPNTWPRCH
ncbi:MAG TPA: transglycosylase family protein [Marmoricola sp.]|nr:transglycosylase family protein [Marmoricola sp.]